MSDHLKFWGLELLNLRTYVRNLKSFLIYVCVILMILMFCVLDRHVSTIKHYCLENIKLVFLEIPTVMFLYINTYVHTVCLLFILYILTYIYFCHVASTDPAILPTTTVIVPPGKMCHYVCMYVCMHVYSTYDKI